MTTIKYLTHDEDDRYEFDVVGESNYKDQLHELIAMAPAEEREQGEVIMLADVLPEPHNKFDSDAIAVWIHGKQVGYVGRGDTGDLHDVIDDEHRAGTRLLVWARIGWDANNPGAMIGVRLDLPDEDLTLTEIVDQMPPKPY